MNQIFKDFNHLLEKIRVIYSKKNYESIKSDLLLQANVVFSDLKRNNSLTIYLSKNAQKTYKGFSTSIGLSFIGPSTEWTRIIKGETSLIAAFTEGTIKIPNIRVNWNRFIKFSYLLSNLN